MKKRFTKAGSPWWRASNAIKKQVDEQFFFRGDKSRWRRIWKSFVVETAVLMTLLVMLSVWVNS